jgi:hypothetical protein
LLKSAKVRLPFSPVLAELSNPAHAPVIAFSAIPLLCSASDGLPAARMPSTYFFSIALAVTFVTLRNQRTVTQVRRIQRSSAPPPASKVVLQVDQTGGRAREGAS